MDLIAGLGNPGKTYEGTRHNVGFAVVRELARKHGLAFRKKVRLKGEAAEGMIGKRPVVLLLPTTYMNLSGEALSATMRMREISQVLVVVDDVAIPFGHLRLRAGGSSGGHNGLKSVEAHLQTQEYARLRVGVSDRKAGDLADYVLEPFSEEENKLLPEIVDRATQAIELWLEQGMNRAMDYTIYEK